MSQAGGISRKKIISKSQEAGLNEEDQMEEEDVWYDKETLFRHHLKEVLDKWSSIDDEIWGKVICMEKNRRVAKAYARVPVLTINGSDDGFDGYRIGLGGFDNPKQSAETAEVKKSIGQGIKLKMDNDGNILIKRAANTTVFAQNVLGSFEDDHCFPPEVVKTKGHLDFDKPVKVFDMKRFTQNITKEIKGPYPDRHKLELQCFTNILFVQKEDNPLDAPCWIMVINIVALDMLKSKLPQVVARGMASARMPALMENVNAKRFLSTPRDEHYPKLVRMRPQDQKAQPSQLHQRSMSQLSVAETKDDVDYYDDRASVSTYSYIPGYGVPVNLLPAEYDVRRQAAADAVAYRNSVAMNYQDMAYAGYRNAAMMHSVTEPSMKLHDMTSTLNRNVSTPALQRFAMQQQQQQHRHSRSYDSELESDMTGSSDDTEYNRWPAYPRVIVQQDKALLQGPWPNEWE